MDLKTTEELHAMSFEELSSYRQMLDAHRSSLRDHCKIVGDRFRNLNDAINGAARLGGDVTALRVTPGVAIGHALAQHVRSNLAPAVAKSPLLASALQAASEPANDA